MRLVTVALLPLYVLLAGNFSPVLAQSASEETVDSSQLKDRFAADVQPLLKKYCFRCHGAETAESGIRVDQLDGTLQERRLKLWDGIRSQLVEETMPPEDETQPADHERKILTDWISAGLHVARSRPVEKNGSVRRLTVSQYRNALTELLGLQEDLTAVLPPEAVSKDGFTNNSQAMLLSPLQVEAYFDIAEKALDLCLVDEDSKPVIQHFRMDLGKGVNPHPLPEKLILGANNHLLANADFTVTEPLLSKPFEFEPFHMQTKYRFNEGYQGNSTVRGWREYDSIYHAVFACMRGNPGYPKGHAYESVPDGLLLRPAIPSAELFGQESTYGPKANFKISLRQLPDSGIFRVTVRAARYEDGLLLDPGSQSAPNASTEATVVSAPQSAQTIQIPQPGIYQVDAYLDAVADGAKPDPSNLQEQLVGYWSLDGHAHGETADGPLTGELTGGAKFADSPFGKAVAVDGQSGAVVIPRNRQMDVGDGEFTVAAWIRPRKLRQGGIVCLGKYSWTHGWYLDMPNGRGVLRIETAGPDNQSNGTVASPPGTIRADTWQHVAAVVRRQSGKTRLYVNGYQVAAGTIGPANLDNPSVDLHIGRIQDSKLFQGDIDEVRIYRRVLRPAEIQALVEPGRKFATAPPPEKPKNLSVQLGERHFSGLLQQPAFMVVRLPKGSLKFAADYSGQTPLARVVFTPLADSDEKAQQFVAFEKRAPYLGVHVGLRRDCGSTFARVGTPQTVPSSQLSEFVFEEAINNFPSPDVQKENDNYLAGVREIGVRSEYTDGRDMPRLRIQSVEFEGPYYEQWPPRTHRRIYIKSEHPPGSQAYAQEIIHSFASRAFRRPVSTSEVASLLAVWKDAYAETGDFQRSIRDTLLVVLTSPQFLFLIENSNSPKPEALSESELASKLSFFLWNGPPDRELRALASQGRLTESLDGQIGRLVEDPRSERFVHQFTGQWFSLDKFDVVEIDRNRYPALTRDTKTELRREPAHFLHHLIRHNLPVRNLIRSDFVMANEVVADYYGLTETVDSGFQFVPVRHGNSHQGGILTQAAVLSGLSDGRESNPVKRGAWLARKIIAEPPDDPPPNVPELDEDLTHLTLRERLERHRNQPGCAGCHEGIDPWGIPFEQFDAGGMRKTQPVDARSTLPDGTEVRDFTELTAYLAEDRIDQVAFSTLKHLSTYAIGRSLTYNEIESLRQGALELKDGNYRIQDMIRFVVKSDLFLTK